MYKIQNNHSYPKLGSATTQAISYIPYGEVFVEQQAGGWYSPYLFNAKELDSETGLYYYGARYLDPSDAMWLSVDPLWEKYVGMTPYQYCMGNPVKYIDKEGEKIYLSFANEAVKTEFEGVIGKLVGNSYQVKLSSVECSVNNAFEMNITEIQSDNNDKVNLFAQELSKLINDESIAIVNVVSDDENVNVGSFASSTIDIYDIQQFDKAGELGTSSAGALIHEFKEQIEKSKLGKSIGEGNMRDYGRCHAKAKFTENVVDGKNRVDFEDFSIFTEPTGAKTKQSIYLDKENRFCVDKKVVE